MDTTMDLANFVRTLLDDEPIGTTAMEASVSAGGLHNLLSGKVKEPQPQTLARLARHFGRNDAERRLLYAEMMERSGYFALLPREMLSALDGARSALAPGQDSRSAYDDAPLFEEIAAILERADREQRARIALDVLRHFYPQEAQAVIEGLQARLERGPASPEADH
jgi:hypothetical protein